MESHHAGLPFTQTHPTPHFLSGLFFHTNCWIGLSVGSGTPAAQHCQHPGCSSRNGTGSAALLPAQPFLSRTTGGLCFPSPFSHSSSPCSVCFLPLKTPRGSKMAAGRAHAYRASSELPGQLHAELCSILLPPSPLGSAVTVTTSEPQQFAAGIYRGDFSCASGQAGGRGSGWDVGQPPRPVLLPKKLASHLQNTAKSC